MPLHVVLVPYLGLFNLEQLVITIDGLPGAG